MKYFLFIFFLFLSFQLSANHKEKYADIDKKISINASLMKTKPRNALINLREIKNKSLKLKYLQGAIKSIQLITEILFQTRADYNQMLSELDLGLLLAKKTNNISAIIQFHRYRSVAYYNQGLMDLGFRELEEALNYIPSLKDPNEQNLKLAHLYGAMVPYYQFKNDSTNDILYLQKSMAKIRLVSDTSVFHLAKKRIMAMQFTDLASILYKRKQIDSAELNYQAAFDLYTNYDLPLFEKSQLVLAMCHFYFQKHAYRKAIQFGQSGLDLLNENNHPLLKKQFYKLLQQSYLEINQIDSSKYFSQLHSTINDSLSVIKHSNLNKTFEQHQKQNELNYQHRKKKMLLIILGSVTLIGLSLGYWFRSSRKQIHQEYQKLINKLKQENQIEESTLMDSEQTQHIVLIKNEMKIPDITVTTLLKKLGKFERSNKFIKPDVTLSSMANDFDSNTRYISEIIKVYRGKNFNNYINGLRINFIIKKLYDDPQYRKYKVAYLAQCAGFASGPNFTSVFKKETGMTPSYFIIHLEK